ncbi:nucleoside deoxyribosyltransferase [Mycobacterium phage Milly]|uniref:hydrolase n=1 Tax=Mycobacterium phage Milly TaxID=1567473 RepID=UPI000572A994|nr:hydrolase [Mycobacterium phage Milly]AJA43728.1 nucleoside deoxyribosyltransferase [Mycobacterium phage Milly]
MTYDETSATEAGNPEAWVDPHLWAHACTAANACVPPRRPESMLQALGAIDELLLRESGVTLRAYTWLPEQPALPAADPSQPIDVDVVEVGKPNGDNGNGATSTDALAGIPAQQTPGLPKWIVDMAADAAYEYARRCGAAILGLPVDPVDDVVYIAGPMTGYPRWNAAAFEGMAAYLRSLGHTVISPNELHEPCENTPWDWYMRRDLVALVKCSTVVMLSGWEDSRGASLEHHVAKALGLRIFYYPNIEGLLP